MTAPLGPVVPVWPQTGWHYRRSLASRVTLLTTMAVGIAIALIALAVFLTVRIQMQASLDDSLLNRAKKAAAGAPTLSEMYDGLIVPSWASGAADVRIIYVSTGSQPLTADQGPAMTLGAEHPHDHRWR